MLRTCKVILQVCGGGFTSGVVILDTLPLGPNWTDTHQPPSRQASAQDIGISAWGSQAKS